MFTGIVEKSVPVLAAEATVVGQRLTLSADWPDVKRGESIAVNGVCLTAADLSPGRLSFDVIPETLAKTNLGKLQAGHLVHVERSLRFGDRLDGHVVQGHVDATAIVVDVQADAGDWRITLEPPKQFARYIIDKGSVTLDGVSLTVAAIEGLRFQVALIPTTLEITQLGRRTVGDEVNLECDSMVKTIVTTMERMKTLVAPAMPSNQ